MASGLLGSVSQSGFGSVTAYTVPAGISHAVVHITLASFDYATNISTAPAKVLVGGRTVLSYQWFSTSTTQLGNSNAVSMMLSPGNTVTLDVGGGTHYCTVSGYEVPL